MRTREKHPSPIKPRNVGKTLRRCRNTEENDNVIHIDLDSEHPDNVIIIDEPSPKFFQGPNMVRKDKKCPYVIFIDDDETPDSHHSGVGVNKNRSSADASSSRNSGPATRNFAGSDDADVEECQFIQKNATPVRLSKGKRTYSGNASTRNHYGLSTDSESESSNSDDNDCELMEDSSGKVQEQWEKAFSRRMKDSHVGHSGVGDRDSTSRDMNGKRHCNVETEEESGQHKKVPFIRKLNNETEVPSCSMKEDFSLDSLLQAHLRDNKSDAHSRSDCREQEDHPDSEPGSSIRHTEERLQHKAPSSYHQQEQSAKEVKCTSPAFTDEKISIAEPWQPQATVIARELENLMPKRYSLKRSASPEKQISPSSSPACDTVGCLNDGSKIVCHQENMQPVPEMPISNHIHSIDPRLQKDSAVSSILREDEKNDHLHSRNGDGLPSVQSCLINVRERLKETDEYKRAVEEEWASRQQALQIQAEEAQHERRLHKRRKAESMRLLDMERRQKERLEEIRNTQKEDEENMNMKEVIRAEVRKDLKKLEVSCRNMASLLHCLGILVGGWPNPLPQEVQIAYKKALLTFHPDRASRSDIRQQVEAEEKFKLINRLKEIFKPPL
ncbi:hypothetical protein ACJIZ3_020032 [Penstemon smallii]|uniref:J domain-containing protein n=1 Tax=Penstemon smallii TaxID=265156 RepID=A0ABD3SHM7_9LAMI